MAVSTALCRFFAFKPEASRVSTHTAWHTRRSQPRCTMHSFTSLRDYCCTYRLRSHIGRYTQHKHYHRYKKRYCLRQRTILKDGGHYKTKRLSNFLLHDFLVHVRSADGSWCTKSATARKRKPCQHHTHRTKRLPETIVAQSTCPPSMPYGV